MITKDGIKLCSLVIHHQAISEINRACVLLFSSCVSIRNSTAALLFLEKETMEGTTGKKNKTKQQTAQRQTEPPQSWTVHGEDADASPAIYLTGTHNWKVCTGTNHWPSVLNHRTIVWPKPQSELYCQQPSWRNKKKQEKACDRLPYAIIKPSGQLTAVFGTLHQEATAFQWTSMMEFHLRWPCPEPLLWFLSSQRLKWDEWKVGEQLRVGEQSSTFASKKAEEGSGFGRWVWISV